ncbi:transmembrane protein 214-A [Uranotaenia lowii]|uniref:transmembrane protein 214-A n=1 Tax=Uranotaenia lowii TaxID=190385 RepID=UPI00247A002F|nr:transmembrane protein 214-A [Uranotaenia lowii]
MSDEWEVVSGKQKKPRKTGGEKNKATSKAGASQIEDADTMDQIRSLYANVKDEFLMMGNKENKNNQNMANGSKSQAGDQKRSPGRTASGTQQAQQQNQNKGKQKQEADKKQQQVRPRFKDLDAALRAIAVSDLRAQLWAVSENFRDNHLMTLKALTGFLNESLRVDTSADPIFSEESRSYPYCVIPQELQSLIDEVIDKAGEQNVQYFYDLTLSNLAGDMNKNLPHQGHKLILQAMAIRVPQICVNNLARNAILRNSFQNRSNIGLTLLWALGQGGFQDPTVGLKVWQDIMVPVIELKTYSKYVTEYIHQILTKHPSVKLEVSSSDFLTILSSLTTQTKSTQDSAVLLDDASKLLVERYVSSAPKTSSTFTTLFKNTQFISKPEPIYLGLILCLNEEPECYTAWHHLYKKNLQQSATLLSFIESSTLEPVLTLLEDRLFHEFLEELQETNEELSQSKKKVEGLKMCTAVLQQVQEKVSTKKNKSPKASSKSPSRGPVALCCSFLLATFLLFGITGGLIGFDTYRAGGKFENSHTGQLLKQAGLLPAVQDGWTCTLKYSARGYKWAEEHVPVYYQSTSKAVGPYVEFSIDFSKILWNGAKKGFGNAKLLVEQKTPVVAEFVEQYAPGLPKKVGDFTCWSWTTVSNFWVNTYNQSCEFFKTKVFVGQLSPENLGKAFNSTQVAAAQYYSWFHDQVDFYAKAK